MKKDNIGVWDVLYLIGNFTYRVVVAFTFFFVFGMATKFHWTTSVITVFLIWFVAYSFAYEAMKIKSHKELGNSVYVLEEKEVLR